MNKSPGEGVPGAIDPTRSLGPDAHGQAALLLVESILHALVERRVLTPGDAITAIQIAAEVKRDLAAQTGEAMAARDESLGLLAAIKQSFAAYGEDGESLA